MVRAKIQHRAPEGHVVGVSFDKDRNVLQPTDSDTQSTPHRRDGLFQREPRSLLRRLPLPLLLQSITNRTVPAFEHCLRTRPRLEDADHCSACNAASTWGAGVCAGTQTMGLRTSRLDAVHREAFVEGPHSRGGGAGDGPEHRIAEVHATAGPAEG